MQVHASDRGVFIRSMASRGHGGGLAGTTVAAASVLAACGFGLVFIETVGTGQSEVEIASIADTTVVVQAPEMGDEVQAIKAGLLEVADLVVVTKGDRPGAERAAAQLRGMLTVGAQHDRAMGDRPRPKRPDVLLASGATGTGVAEIIAALDRRAAPTDDRSADRGSAQVARAEAQLTALLAERVSARLRDPAQLEATEAIVGRVARHEQDPYSAADELLSLLF
jgi:LAO/AO transport system kinase